MIGLYLAYPGEDRRHVLGATRYLVVEDDLKTQLFRDFFYRGSHGLGKEGVLVNHRQAQVVGVHTLDQVDVGTPELVGPLNPLNDVFVTLRVDLSRGG